MRVLIIGGAGFIGSHTGDELYKKGYKIRILDNLSPKIHTKFWPIFLSPNFEKIKGDARSKKDLEKALSDVDYVIHLAAYMDLMPDISTFFDLNVTSTALLYELIIEKKLPIKKVIIASSQFVYGEGRWSCLKHGEVFPKVRTLDQLRKKNWEPSCPLGGETIKYLGNQETDQDPPNQYAISKFTQEMIALKLGRLYGIPSVAMRYSIVHGPRQSLKNAYSGALRIFTLQILSNQELTIYEDGKSKRDYVSVFDVARANALVLENAKADFENFNVGGGKIYTVLDLVNFIAKALNKKINLILSYKFRLGDVRHAVSDISKLKALGWTPLDDEASVVRKYVNWVVQQKINTQIIQHANATLKQKGVVLKSHQ